jgi:hypothetical protein
MPLGKSLLDYFGAFFFSLIGCFENRLSSGSERGSGWVGCFMKNNGKKKNGVLRVYSTPHLFTIFTTRKITKATMMKVINATRKSPMVNGPAS